uniref:Uncharacterized protein n=1 Tax=Lepeophtheirus salmonis TaxID=72036 RepID=A0A0K2U8C8_LEPSM
MAKSQLLSAATKANWVNTGQKLLTWLKHNWRKFCISSLDCSPSTMRFGSSRKESLCYPSPKFV